MTEVEVPDRRSPYWLRYSDGSPAWRDKGRVPPGEALAALRSGEGREPFTVPAMWPYLTEVGPDWFDRPASDRDDHAPEVVAEHHTLVIFGIHQQAQPSPVHRTSAGVGYALKRLHTSGRFSQDAVDRRFYATVTADDLSEMTHHLRGMVRQLRSLPVVTPLDYKRLYDDLVRWQDPFKRDRVRRRWGRGYHAFGDSGASDAAVD